MFRNSIGRKVLSRKRITAINRLRRKVRLSHSGLRGINRLSHSGLRGINRLSNSGLRGINGLSHSGLRRINGLSHRRISRLRRAHSLRKILRLNGNTGLRNGGGDARRLR